MPYHTMHTHLEWLSNPTQQKSDCIPIYIHFYKQFESQPHETFAFHHISHDTQFVEATRALVKLEVPQHVQQYIAAFISNSSAMPTDCGGYLDVTIITQRNAPPMNLNNIASMDYEGGDSYRVNNNDEFMELQHSINALKAELRDLYHRAAELERLEAEEEEEEEEEEEDLESEEFEMATFESMEMYTPMNVPASKSAVDQLEKVRVESDAGVCSICWEEFEAGSEATLE